MKLIGKLIGIGLITPFLFGCDSVKRNNNTPMTTVASVDIAQLQGTWHVAARMPAFFEKDCINSSATYGTTSDPNVISIINECDSISEPGKRDRVEGAGTIQDSTNAKLKIRLDRFPGNLFAGDFWVIRKADNYNWIIVSEPQGRYLWIMSKDKKMDEVVLTEQIEWIEKDGWDITHLIDDNN